MPPKALRTVTKKAAAVLPGNILFQSLADSSLSLLDVCPQLAERLGRTALEVAEDASAMVHKRDLARLCQHCGSPITAQTCAGIETFQLTARSRRGAAATATVGANKGASQSGSWTAPLPSTYASSSGIVVVKTCKVCQDRMRQVMSQNAADQVARDLGQQSAPAQTPQGAQHRAVSVVGPSAAKPLTPPAAQTATRPLLAPQQERRQQPVAAAQPAAAAVAATAITPHAPPTAASPPAQPPVQQELVQAALAAQPAAAAAATAGVSAGSTDGEDGDAAQGAQPGAAVASSDESQLPAQLAVAAAAAAAGMCANTHVTASAAARPADDAAKDIAAQPMPPLQPRLQHHHGQDAAAAAAAVSAQPQGPGEAFRHPQSGSSRQQEPASPAVLSDSGAATEPGGDTQAAGPSPQEPAAWLVGDQHMDEDTQKADGFLVSHAHEDQGVGAASIDHECATGVPNESAPGASATLHSAELQGSLEATGEAVQASSTSQDASKAQQVRSKRKRSAVDPPLPHGAGPIRGERDDGRHGSYPAMQRHAGTDACGDVEERGEGDRDVYGQGVQDVRRGFRAGYFAYTHHPWYKRQKLRTLAHVRAHHARTRSQ